MGFAYGKVSYPNGNVWDNHCEEYWGLSEGPLGVSDWPTTWNGSPAFRLADGGTIVFGSTQWPFRATKIIDPYGQETNIMLRRRLRPDYPCDRTRREIPAVYI